MVISEAVDFRYLRGSRLRLDYIVKKITNRKQHLPILKKLFTIYADISDSIFGMTHDTMRQMRCTSGRFNLKCPFREFTHGESSCISINTTASYVYLHQADGQLRVTHGPVPPTTHAIVFHIHDKITFKAEIERGPAPPASGGGADHGCGQPSLVSWTIRPSPQSALQSATRCPLRR